MDNFYVPTSILIDLSNAFDTLDHDIVLSKLRYYVISGIELNFFAGYLLERFQYVDYSGVCSKKLSITTGVPPRFCPGAPIILNIKADKMISNVYCIKEANIYLKQTKT